MIEDALRRSDRRLARMLTRFKVPLLRGGLVIAIREPRRRRRVVMAAIAVIAVALLVVAVWNSPATPLTCSAPSRPGPAATTAQASICPLAMHRGHLAGTAVTGPAK